MQELREKVARIAATSETVLVTGESGTGKELVARMIHAKSLRKDKPWVTLNCPALSSPLLESELFGHKRGAFTGADVDRVGRFEMADQGTIFLDEISEIAPTSQSKLLRVLQEQTLERVGSCDAIRVDVRVVAATNRNLDEEINEGRFREDLFYRLAVLPVEIPPLRDRREDIPELVEYLTKKISGDIILWPEPVMNLLQNYNWPGNVRQLENIVKRAIVLCPGSHVTTDEVMSWIFPNPKDIPTKIISPEDTPSKIISGTFKNGQDFVKTGEEFVPENELFRVGMTFAEAERRLVELTLKHFNGNRSKAAEALGIGVRTLFSKLQSYRRMSIRPHRSTFSCQSTTSSCPTSPSSHSFVQ